ncbi:MAG: hypothetical protein IKU79_05685 [Bacteroidaceae bacterium]|nr:hypothetical protein [Bacteroidaceae bacterium]
MKLNIVVLAKQVPNTRNVGPDAMTAGNIIMSHLLMQNALKASAILTYTCKLRPNSCGAEVEKQFTWIRKMTPHKVEYYR